MDDYTKTPRTRLRRASQRGQYDRDTVHAILDAGALCHVGYVIDGQPYVTPTLYWREGERVYWHGSAASRMVRHQAGGEPICLTVSHLDALVLARSAFHHSVNYRSVMILGHARLVEDDAEKAARLKTFVDGLFPGRWDELRPMTAQELKATSLLVMDLNEVSAKVRSGGPIDDEEDYDWPTWAGVVPLHTQMGDPEPCPRLADSIDVPTNLMNFLDFDRYKKI
ncbi:MAG: pyridoxamine 5'-phosphate oxidase family protein [Rhodospirillales bacterium]|nr:pyridoxamine 5'-phosphate oxidase family protein [Rhodospirillales bacterium]